MIEAKDIAALARFAAAHGVTELEFDSGGTGLTLRLDPAPAARPAPPAAPPAAPVPVAVKAPAFGLFRRGDAAGTVARDAILGHVRLDALLVPVRAPVAGAMGTLPEDGALIGYGDIVTTITPAEAGV